MVGPGAAVLFLVANGSSTRGVDDADRIRELEDALCERDVRIAAQAARIAELERLLAELQSALEAWKRGHRVPPGGKLAQKKKRRARATGRPPGRPAGHAGAGRPGPGAPTEWVEIPSPTVCPFCRGGVVPTAQTPFEQRVEELVPAHVKVVGYRRHHGQCTQCERTVQAPLPDGLGDNPKLGVQTQAAIVATKTELGLTLGQTQKLFATQGLAVSRGGIQQILHRAADVLAPGLVQIQAAIVGSEVAWADESAHKVAGESGYLWLVMIESAVLFTADRSRGQEVAQRLLAGFTGTLHSDFYAVYWTLAGVDHAPCWGHLCREARQLAERTEHLGTLEFSVRLSALYVRGVHAQAHPATTDRTVQRLEADLLELAEDRGLGNHADVARLQDRIAEHLDDLLAFVTNPALEATNHRAEREFRPHAMARHRSGGARSERGAQTYATNVSIVRTLQLQGLSYADVLRRARIAAHAEQRGDESQPFPDILPRLRSPTGLDPPPAGLN